MNLSTHVAVGAAVGYLCKNPALGFCAGIISHHLIDGIPHSDGGALEVDVKDYAKDKRIVKVVTADLLLVAAIICYILYLQGFSWPIVLGAFGAVLPDLIDNMPFWSPQIRKTHLGYLYHRFHEKFHYTIKEKSLFWTGIVNQFILIAISLRILV